jgi:hypothetical protein
MKVGMPVGSAGRLHYGLLSYFLASGVGLDFVGLAAAIAGAQLQ